MHRVRGLRVAARVSFRARARPGATEAAAGPAHLAALGLRHRSGPRPRGRRASSRVRVVRCNGNRRSETIGVRARREGGAARRSRRLKTHPPEGDPMSDVGLLVSLEAKPERADDVAALLAGALDLVRQEPGTVTWFAIRLGPTTFGIFDTFRDEAGRQAHLAGQVAAALMENAPALLAEDPVIEQVEVLAQL